MRLEVGRPVRPMLASPGSSLDAALTDLGPEELERSWGREPRHVPAAALPTPFDDLLTTRDVDDLLSRRGLRTPFLRVARDGHMLADADFTRGGGVGAGVTDQLDDTALLRLFAEGHTLVLQGLHRTHPPVLELAQDLAAAAWHEADAAGRDAVTLDDLLVAFALVALMYGPVLMRLKELEALEKITEKIDKLTVFGGLEGVMKQLVSLKGIG